MEKRFFFEDLKRMIRGIPFIIALASAVLFAFLSALYMTDNNGKFNPEAVREFFMKNGEFTRNPNLQIMGLCQSWVGGEGLSLVSSLFYTLLPILSSLPFAWSFHEDKSNNYIYHIVTRISKLKYIFIRSLTIFISGAIIGFIPILINLLFISSHIPYLQPIPSDAIYNHVEFGDMWADIYYERAIEYIIRYVILDTVFCGLLAMISFAVSMCSKHKLVIICGPFLIFLGMSYFETLISRLIPWSIEVVPTQFLHSAPLYFRANAFVVLAVGCLLVVIIFVLIIIRGIRHDVL